MDSFNFYGDEEMFDSEDVFDIDGVYNVPVDVVVYLKNRSEPIFAQHVFFFEKEDPVRSMDEMMSFTTTWWSAICEDKNIDYVYLTDSLFNKKAIRLEDVAVVSFMRPEQPEWMTDGQDNTDSG